LSVIGDAASHLHRNRRASVRIPPGSKVFRALQLGMLLFVT
jgi:hypothetical protein